MHRLMIVILLATTGYAQSMLETAAAAAGGSVGGVAGKKLGEGLAGVLNKVDKTAASAAKASVSKSESSGALIEVGPGVPKAGPSVPPPPPIHRAAARKVARTSVPEPPAAAPSALVALIAPPPPPEVTRDDLRKISSGMHRDAVLDLGQPAVRITMFEDGHLLEIYRYMAKDITIGSIRLIDGSVATVQMP